MSWSRAASERPAVRGAWILVAAGLAALLLRANLVLLSGSARVFALAVVGGALLWACLLVPIADDRRPVLAPWTGAALGLAAVGLATVVSGPPPPLPFVAWALPLSVLAAVAEEALFRRVAYGWLARWGVVAAIGGSAVLFAAIHVPLYGVAVLPVDLGAGLLLAWQRWATGTWTVPAATHVAANVVATMVR